MGEAKTKDLIRALVVVWPKWMARIHAASTALINAQYGENLDDYSASAHKSRELLFEDAAYRNSLGRIQRDIVQLKSMDKIRLRDRIRDIVHRERYYNKLRLEALSRRLNGVFDHHKLRSEDPRSDYSGGALWVMDYSKETHTNDCVAMAGKVWSWAVLRYVNPTNRHPGCGCSLAPDPSLVHGVSGQAMPISILPAVAEPSWDMGLITPKPMIDIEYNPASFFSLHRSRT